MNSFEVVVVKILVAICRYLIKDQVVTPKYMRDAIADGEQFVHRQERADDRLQLLRQSQE